MAEIDVLPAAQGGNPAEYLPMLAVGNLQLAILAPGRISAVHPTLATIALPGLISEPSHLQRLYASNDVMGTIRKDVGAMGVEFLAMVPEPGVAFVSRDVKSVADLRGRKILAGSPPQAEILTKLGAIPVNLPFAQAGSALTNGAIDGFETSFEGFLFATDGGKVPGTVLPGVASFTHVLLGSTRFLARAGATPNERFASAARAISLEVATQIAADVDAFTRSSTLIRGFTFGDQDKKVISAAAEEVWRARSTAAKTDALLDAVVRLQSR